MIYTFGNSHSNFFTDTHPSINGVLNIKEPFASYSLGAIIGFNFEEHHLPKVNDILAQIDIKNNDYIMLVVGEVDCRVWLPKIANEQNRTYEDVTIECVDRLFKCVLDLKRNKKQMICWGNHPSTTREGNYGTPDYNPSEPIYGSCLLRNYISKLWEDRLSYLCHQNNIPFVSILRQLIGVDGLTKMEYFDDYVHLNYEKVFPMILDKFRELKLV